MTSQPINASGRRFQVRPTDGTVRAALYFGCNSFVERDYRVSDAVHAPSSEDTIIVLLPITARCWERTS
jgi:hypothetical protein